MDNNKKQYLRDFINDYCIFRCPPGWGLEGLPKGNIYQWQFYPRRAIFYQWTMEVIANWLVDTFQEGTQYAAMETAGPPMLAAAQAIGQTRGIAIPGFAIRKDQKKYGLKNWVEGFPDPSKPVIILDDLANSKSTIIRAAGICTSMGLAVAGAKTIINKKAGTTSVDGIPVESIFQLTDFEMSWGEYYRERPEPNVLEFVKRYENVLVRRIPQSV